VQDLALSFAELHAAGLSPAIQPVHIALQGPPLPRQINTPVSLVSSAKLLRVCPMPSSRSLIKISNRTGLSIDPWGTPLVTGHQLVLTPFTTTLWNRPSSQFLTQPKVYLSKPWAASFSRRILSETVLKALLKSSYTMSIAFLSSIGWVTQS